ncbi:flagellar hook protein FlgE [Methylocucumis oryzae]|uniref:Flagellar hook protein FlgE n=1 Tax=Methylocucumis oryzae TaxID=1632867 RepID=A0A0F3IK61_9GAMM|nr:flagellar hook protein FlgE [Methylocucumis oryzae]KJV07086.1 flagellar hook-basal body protein [Methylocucumis oryzae]
MSFSTALSGLNAAANNLSVTGNNIANANTVGFKESRSEFMDLYANNMVGLSKIQPGTGVRVAAVAQQFGQGTMQATENNLDLAISGEGFFTLANDTNNLNSVLYTRAGQFKLNADGTIVNNQGQALLAYAPNGTKVEDGFSQGVLTTVNLNTSAGLPNATTEVDLSVNLKASSITPTETFDPLVPNSYNNQTSVTVYDSLGVAHKLTTYFVAGASTADGRDWSAYHYITDNPAAPVSVDAGNTPATLTFDSTGKLTSPSDGLVSLAAYTPGNAAADLTMTLNYSGTTQLASAFSVNKLKQDGLAAGELSGLSVDSSGVIFAKYTNGGATPLGQIALARFTNNQGLAKLGDTNWGQSIDSGPAVSGVAGTGSFGKIAAGTLEQSNVDISTELVNLIIAQQAYQANSQTISTENSIVQNLLNNL